MSAMLICSWCLIVMQAGEKPASHGICKGCQELFFPEHTPRAAEVADSGQAFADDFERVHGHAGQSPRNIY